MTLPAKIEIAKEVQEIILICSLGIIIYVVMVTCILCRPRPVPAEGLNFDGDQESFVKRSPEDEEGFYFAQSEMQVLREAASKHVCRLVVDCGSCTLIRDSKERFNLIRSVYGMIDVDEPFDIQEQSEDLLFHLELFDRKLELNKVKTS